MNSVINRKAKNLYRQAIHLRSIKIDDFKHVLNKEVSDLYDNRDKFDFLDQFLLDTEEYYDDHLSECTNTTNTCPINITCENAIYYTKQEKAKLKQAIENEATQRGFSTYIGSIVLSGPNSFVNTGNLVDTIINNSQQLQASGQQNISDNIAELAKVIEGLEEITANQKNEFLETVKFLSEQALLEEDKRANKSTIKVLIKGLFDSLSAVSSISTIVGTDLTEISKFFLESPK
jgi:Rad3-related DNA helicase